MKRLLPFVFLLAACTTAPEPVEESVKPGINESFLDPELDVDEFVKRFEVESREIYVERDAIADVVGLLPGQEMADVGAGTGLFLERFAKDVGPDGKVYAVDIAEPMIEHMRARADDLGLSQVVPHLCGERSVDLPRRSIDVAFICDTYHHFEYPRSTMGSIHSALRGGGVVILVDFERIPGVTREWLMNHVRAGKEEVIAEMESFDFELLGEVEVDGLEENYVLRFRKR